MVDEKSNRYEHLPIPTYEEATSSRLASSQSRVGPGEISDDAERQGLLSRDNDDSGTRARNGNYEPPRVESERSSFDSLDGLDDDDETHEVRREMQEMDIEEPDGDNGSHRSLLTYRFKRFTSFTSSFTSLSLPSFRRFLPSFSFPRLCVNIDWQAVDANRIVILGRLFGIFIIMGVLYALIATDLLTLGRNRKSGTMYEPESVRNYVQKAFDEAHHLQMHYQHIAKFPHVAGTEGSYVLGEWIAEVFKEHKLQDVGLERFDVYMNYPQKDGRSVAVVEPNMKWQARLEENDAQTAVFHGYSATGDVNGPLVYANFGSASDFARLAQEGIPVKGAIVLMRQHGAQDSQGSKVKAAQDAGAMGCLIFSDPTQSTSSEPDGGRLADDGVQRGSVGLISHVLGDPMSPGWASTPAMKQRLSPEESPGLVTIPSLPISWHDGHHLLSILRDKGKKMNGEWAGQSDVEYWTGDASSPRVQVKNLQDVEMYQPIYNVIGGFVGWEQPAKKVIIGNHRDSWCLGAASPGSGTAILLALTRIFGELWQQDWRPRRTIEFVNWDAGEFNAVGSTEHVENREDELRQNGIAYINIGAGVTGSDFSVSGSPMFADMLQHALKRVGNPGGNDTVYKFWEDAGTPMPEIGVRGDATPFQHIAGMSSIDLSFKGQWSPEGSCYDNLDWISNYADPGGSFDRSSILGQIVALLVLELADSPLTPFDIGAYTASLKQHTEDLAKDISDLTSAPPIVAQQIATLQSSMDLIISQTRIVHDWDMHWYSMFYASGGAESAVMEVKRIDRNNRVANFEASLLLLPKPDKNGFTGAAVKNPGGLPDRSQYKHSIHAPKLDNPGEIEYFPSIRYHLRRSEWELAASEITRVAELLDNAGRTLTL